MAAVAVRRDCHRGERVPRVDAETRRQPSAVSRTDFLLFHYGSWSWPAFNVADSAISVGAALLIFDSFRDHADHRRPAAPTEPR
jgi:hypothetical protein